MLIKCTNQPEDVQLWDNRDGTWMVTPYSSRARQLFEEQYGMVTFLVKDSDVFKVLLLCFSNGLLIGSVLDVYLPTLMDQDGNPVKDPKEPNK